MIALGLLGIGLSIRIALEPWLGNRLSYPSVITVIVITSWSCGAGPAIVIAVIGYPLIEVLIRDVPFSAGDTEYIASSLVLYAGLVGVIVYFVSTRRRAHEHVVVAQEELSRSEQQNRAWFAQAASGIAEIDVDYRLRRVNPEMCRMLGYECEELIGRSIDDVTAPENRRRKADLMSSLDRGELNRLDCDNRYVRRDGSVIWAHATVSAIRDASGRPHHYIAIVDDISARKNAENVVRESQERFEQLANHIPQAFWITDLERREVIYVSPAFERIHGVSLGSMRPVRSWKKLLRREDRVRVLEALRALASGPADVQYRIVRPDGAIRWVHARGYPIRNAEGVVYRVAGTIEDITERRQLEDRLHHQAHFDSLTGLPNRVLFFDRLGQALHHARREAHAVGLLFVDIDNFKIVNDTMGHDVGDKLLVHIAQGLKQSVRSEDTVARLGGDEFAIILPRVHQSEDGSLIAQKVLDALSQISDVVGRKVSVAASIGVAISSSDGTEAQTLIKNADHAMFRAKQLGKNGYAFYTDAMNDRVAEQRVIEGLLSRALDDEEFSLHFQPKVNIKTGELTGCEALLRWSSPGRSVTSPAQFVPILEQCGLIVPVGEWVVRAACMQIADWKRSGLTPVPVAVNVSAKQFNQRNFPTIVENAIRSHGLTGNLLEMELTESVAMQNPEETIKAIYKLKELGVKIAIDDFGTGHSSLSYLNRLPIDVLKIDRSFVTGLPENGSDVSIAKAIITMAHSLSMKVIAEGVEHERQLAFLAENDCDEVQGYLLSRPVPAPEMTRLMQGRWSLPRHGTMPC